nr:hypothetical protein [Tanacetum cinerariifolium]
MAFRRFFGEEHQTFRKKMIHNLDQLRLHFERENLHAVNVKIYLKELHTKFQEFFDSEEINAVQAVDAYLVVTESSGIESENNSSANALSKSVNETHMQMQNGKIDMGKALDVGLVVIESSGTTSDKQDISIKSKNNTTHVVDADIRLVNDQEPLAEIDSNTAHDSTNMSNNGGKTDQDTEQYHVKSTLPASLIDQPITDQSYQSLVAENISLKKTIA